MDKDDLTHQLSAPQRVPRVALSLLSVVSCLLSLSASLSLSLVSFLLLLLSLSYSCSFSPTFSFSMVGGDDVFIHCNSCVGLRGCNRLTRCSDDTEYVRKVHGIQLHRDIQWRRWRWRLEWSGVDVAVPQSQQEFMHGTCAAHTSNVCRWHT